MGLWAHLRVVVWSGQWSLRLFLELKDCWESVIPKILRVVETECFHEFLFHLNFLNFVVDVREESTLMTINVHQYGKGSHWSLGTSFFWGLWANCNQYLGLVFQRDGGCHYLKNQQTGCVGRFRVLSGERNYVLILLILVLCLWSNNLGVAFFDETKEPRPCFEGIEPW